MKTLSKAMLELQKNRLRKSDIAQRAVHYKDGRLKSVGTILKELQKSWRGKHE